MDELIAADRGFAAASAKTDLISGLSAMFADDVIMPTPAAQFAEGKAQAVEALRSNPANAESRIEWTPLRGGLAADAMHGYTVGYVKLYRKDGTVTPLKYLSYWVKGAAGWRVAAYKRHLAAGSPKSTALMPASLPPALVAPTEKAAAIAAHRHSLEEAEAAFSREAQRIGLGPAFTKFGAPDATNIGGPDNTDFVVGAEAIGRVVGGATGGPPSPVSWAADKKAIVASSGDLGVSIGFIRPNKPPADPKQPAASPFFTIWRRTSPAAPWRYIAE